MRLEILNFSHVLQLFLIEYIKELETTRKKKKTKLTYQEAMDSLTLDEAKEVITIQQEILRNEVPKDITLKYLKDKIKKCITNQKLPPIIDISQLTYSYINVKSNSIISKHNHIDEIVKKNIL
jgi:hypothetical protein